LAAFISEHSMDTPDGVTMKPGAMRLCPNALVLATIAFLARVAVADAGVVHVAVDGIDSAGCGAKASPCETITQGIRNAGVGDKIIVGPGSYLAESGAPGCGCFLAVNKPVKLVSSDGAAATVIDASRSPVQTDVLVIADGSEFGKPGKGFTVRGTNKIEGTGIAIDAKHVKIRGNQVIGPTILASPGVGIAGVMSNPGPMLIKGNQVMFWGEAGIQGRGDGKKVVGNQVSMVGVGIEVDGTSSAIGNVVTDSFVGIQLLGGAAAIGNAVRGNTSIGIAINGVAGTITGNDIIGNVAAGAQCGLQNASTDNTVDATNNYWGAATGPGAPPADSVCNTPGDHTTTAPFATEPFNVTAVIKP
jgi:hypothetical protein